MRRLLGVFLPAWICSRSLVGGQLNRLAALIERPSHRVFTLLLAGLGIFGYFYAVRLPSVGFNVHLYSAFGTYFNATGSLPVEGQSIGSEPFLASYVDFPAISLQIYRLLALTGEEPNRFVWAAYYVVPVVLAAMALARLGGGAAWVAGQYRSSNRGGRHHHGLLRRARIRGQGPLFLAARRGIPIGQHQSITRGHRRRCFGGMDGPGSASPIPYSFAG